ncbi:MAG: DNA internalization-related competence protein ComEC/Rec2 [Thermodesulfovibrionales bacterium]|nr:DNA internalization-related competence protein ComEC/Rec2 [Thermodesulfovibrionales bacterium]
MVIFLSFISGVIFFYLSRFFPYTGLILSISTLIITYFNSSKTPLQKASLIALMIICFTIGYGYANFFDAETIIISNLSNQIINIKGRVSSQRELLSKKIGDAYLISIKVEEVSSIDGKKLEIPRLNAIGSQQFDTKKLYHFIGRFSKEGDYLNPYSKSKLPIFYIHSAKEIGDYSYSFFEKQREKLNDFIRNSFSEKASAFLLSITTGERSFLTKETNQAFNLTGLAHILSISGSHFGLLFLILFTSFRTVFLYLPLKLLNKITLYVSPTQIAGIMTAPFLIFYLSISSLSVPTIRAFTMITLFMIGLLISRKGFWLNTLIIAALIVILIEPSSVLDLSAQLSFISVLCIGLIVEKIKDNEHPLKASLSSKRKELKSLILKALKNIKRSFLISIGATLGTAPLVAYYFNYFSLVSPVTNITITPLIGFIVLPVTLLSSMLYIITGFFPLSAIIDKITTLTLNLIEFIAGFDFIAIKIPTFPEILLITFYAALLMYIILNYGIRPNNKNTILLKNLIPLLILILPILIYVSTKIIEPKVIKITYLDVGQGDASVVELPSNKVIVIDTGKSGYQVSAYLRYRGVDKIDALVVTHSQTDHAGGIGYLLDNFEIGEIWINIFEEDSVFYGLEHKIKKLSRGDVIRDDDVIINVLHPYHGFYTLKTKDEENNYSLVLRIDGYRNSFLFTGDIQLEAQEDLVNLGQHLNSTVLKVPHHGSKSSAHEGFLRLVSPSISIISVGRQNPHGHPHEEILSQLQSSLLLRTDFDGAIGLEEFPDGNIEIKTCKDFHYRQAKDIKDEITNIKRLFTVW